MCVSICIPLKLYSGVLRTPNYSQTPSTSFSHLNLLGKKDRWDFTKDIAKARMYHRLPEPRLLIGRQLAEEMVRDIALVNFHGRKTMDRAGFTFLVASGHISIGKTRIGKETPRLVSEACSQVNGVDFAEPVYLQINFRQGAEFDPYRFDQPELSPSEALGARLMRAFYCSDMKLKKTRHDDALAHIVKHVRTDSSRPDAVVPIVIHFDGHAGFITDRNMAFGNDKGKDFFLSMLQEIGSAGTAIESDLRDLHLAGNYFIVPIATGATFSSANFDQFPSCYCVGQVPLPVLDMQQTIQLASLYLHLVEKLSSDRFAEIMENPLFQIALGDTGGLPGFIRFACQIYEPEHVWKLHTKVFCSVDAVHLRHWHTTVVSVFLARPVVSMGDILEADYTVRDAIYSGTVFLRNPGELGLAPALLSKFNKDYTHQLFNPLLVKTLTTADQWTWQDFEKAHVLFLSATMAAIIKEQKRFSQITLGTFLRNVQPEASHFLSYRLCLPKTFNAVGFKKQTRQCIPRSNAKPGSKHDVCTEGLSEIFVVADGTPIIDSFLNIDLQTTGTNQQRTTLFIQYKHSGLESETSVSTMNYQVNMLANWLAECGWSEHQEWIFLWVTNRKVVEDALPHDKLLWVSRAELMDHAPVLGSRGLVPIEVPRGDE
jgi:hypothetical protein